MAGWYGPRGALGVKRGAKTFLGFPSVPVDDGLSTDHEPSQAAYAPPSYDHGVSPAHTPKPSTARQPCTTPEPSTARDPCTTPEPWPSAYLNEDRPSLSAFRHDLAGHQDPWVAKCCCAL